MADDPGTDHAAFCAKLFAAPAQPWQKQFLSAIQYGGLRITARPVRRVGPVTIENGKPNDRS